MDLLDWRFTKDPNAAPVVAQRLVAVASDGLQANKIVLSDNAGLLFTSVSPPEDNAWQGVAYSPSLQRLVAVASTGTNRVMYSNDFGATWIAAAAAAANAWRSVTWSPTLNLFVAVASSGAGNRVMTSPDGIVWTIRVSAADRSWELVQWFPAFGLFIAAVGTTGAANCVMTSPDGIVWTIRTTTSGTISCWAYDASLGVLLARSQDPIGYRTTDGITWTSAVLNAGCRSMANNGAGVFVVMGATDASQERNTTGAVGAWSAITGVSDFQWLAMLWLSTGVFVAISSGADRASQRSVTGASGTWANTNNALPATGTRVSMIEIAPQTDAGTRTVSVGFNGSGEGLSLTPKNQVYVSNEIVDDVDGYVYSRNCANDRPQLASGLVLVSATITVPEELTLPGELVVTYGGNAMTFNAAVVQPNGLVRTFELAAYLWIGDGSLLLQDFLRIDMSAGGYADPDEISVGVTIAYVDGVAQASPGFLSAGVANTFTTPLTLDPGPGATSHEMVAAFVAAGQAGMTIQLATDGYSLGQFVTSSGGIAGLAFFGGDSTAFNCQCETDANARTLLSMRQELLLRTGYASQVNNPPPGIASLYNSYLRSAQEFIYRKYKALQTERFFMWQLKQGVRFYGVRDNANACAVNLDRYKVSGAWLEDLNGDWRPLIYGIDPVNYTSQNFQGWPSLWELRQCIEVFPAPQAQGYKLWIKGHFGLNPFAVDADMTTIDAEPVLLWAIGLAKSHKGDRDAGIATPGKETGYYGQAIGYMKTLIAGSHVNRRYIPGSEPTVIPTPPTMTQFDS